MAGVDAESRGGPAKNGSSSSDDYSSSPSSATDEGEARLTSWLVPMVVVANIAAFVVMMYVNDCPKHHPTGGCVARSLGRFSFEPLRLNPLFGPSNSTGIIFLLSGFGGSVLSSLFSKNFITVGASGALSGLLGAMLSELFTNWTLHTNKAAALVTLAFAVAVNLAIGILPHVNNLAHVGGFLMGFLLGFVMLPRPQLAWLECRSILDDTSHVQFKFEAHQKVLALASLLLLLTGFTVGVVMLFQGKNVSDHCRWCHYLSCVPTDSWSCDGN